jgi:hypothetical protein
VWVGRDSARGCPSRPRRAAPPSPARTVPLPGRLAERALREDPERLCARSLRGHAHPGGNRGERAVARDRVLRAAPLDLHLGPVDERRALVPTVLVSPRGGEGPLELPDRTRPVSAETPHQAEPEGQVRSAIRFGWQRREPSESQGSSRARRARFAEVFVSPRACEVANQVCVIIGNPLRGAGEPFEPHPQNPPLRAFRRGSSAAADAAPPELCPDDPSLWITAERSCVALAGVLIDSIL